MAVKKVEKEPPSPNDPHRSYRNINRAVLGVVLYCMAQPVVLPLLGRVLPNALTTCGSVRLFGHPCPMCGLTRGLGEQIRGNCAAATQYNILTIPVLLLLLLETAYRTYASFAHFPANHLPKVTRIDRLTHLTLLAAYIAYSIIFYQTSR